MKKRAILTLTIISMCLALIGCGKKDKITASDLLENPFGKEKVESMDIDADINTTLSLDMSILMGKISSDKNGKEDTSVDNDTLEGIDQSDPTGFDLEDEETMTSFDVSFALDANIKYDKDTQYVNGNITYDVFGISDSVNKEEYIQLEDGIKKTYTYDNNDKRWYETHTDINENANIENVLNLLSMDIYSDCEAEATKDGYEITGVAATDKITDFVLDTEMVPSEQKELIDEVNKYDFYVTMKFDKNRVIKEINIDCKKNTEETVSVEVKNLVFNITFNSINNVKVTVPDDITEDTVYPNLEEVTEEYDIDESETESNVMAYEIFGKTSVDTYDITDVISKTYMKMPDDDVIVAMVNMVNSNTVEKFTKNLESFNQWNEYNKIAVVYYYGLGVFTMEDLEKYGCDRDYILQEYNERHNIEK